MYGVQQWILFLAGVLVILLNIVFVQGCPPECSCENSPLPTVSCIYQSLTSIPYNIPINTVILNLHGNRISNLNPGLEHLRFLQILDISSNEISTIDFPYVLNIRKLYLQSNKIETIQSGAFQNFTNVIELNLANNSLTNVNFDFFSELKNLQKLDLSDSNIRTIDSNTNVITESSKSPYLSRSLSSIQDTNLTVFAQLEELILAGNKIADLRWTMFCKMDKVKVLDLTNNLIPYLDNESFPTLPALTELRLDSNKISYITKEAFKSVSALKVLSLNENKLAEIIDPIFQPLSQLNELSLCYLDDLVYLSKRALSGLTNLKVLNLCQNQQLSFIHIQLFSELDNIQFLNVSFNNISSIHATTFPKASNFSVNLEGNPLICDCRLEWLISRLQNNETYPKILHEDTLTCSPDSKVHFRLKEIDTNELHCDIFNVSTSNANVSAKIGSSIVLTCQVQGTSTPSITWITARNVHHTFHKTHDLALRGIPSIEEVELHNGTFHVGHEWHESGSYYSELESWSGRMTILQDGSLYIDYLLRGDSGPYKCIVEDPRGNSSSVEITLRLDHEFLAEIKMMGILVGLGCSASFFMLNLIHVIITCLARRCINQRRREAILQVIENFDNYRSTQLGRIKDNYNTQLGKIRDTYHTRVAKLRENYTLQRTRIKTGASHIREGASHRVDTIKDNYNHQLGKLRDYSSHQVEQVRERYNNQLVKIREYGSFQLGRAREKYKLKQQHVMKLLETMNMDNCRTMLDTECVRAESMLFVDDFTVENEGTVYPSPVDSNSVSEYETASSTNGSTKSSLENLTIINEDNLNIPQDVLNIEEDNLNLHDDEMNINVGNDNGAIVTQDTLTCDSVSIINEDKPLPELDVFVEIRMMDDTDSVHQRSENDTDSVHQSSENKESSETVV